MDLGGIIIAIIRLVIAVAAIIGFFGTIVGIPVGIVLMIVRKNKDDRKVALWLIVGGGPALLMATFLLWALIALISIFFAVNILSISGV